LYHSRYHLDNGIIPDKPWRLVQPVASMAQVEDGLIYGRYRSVYILISVN